MRRGCIVAAFGRHYQVELADGCLATGFPRGKKSQFAVGDIVTLSDSGQIEAHEPRHSLLYRSDAFRQKLIAANVSHVVLVVATEPSFSDLLLTRALAAAEDQELKALIVLNKIDLPSGVPGAREILSPFSAAGYRIIEMSARQGVEALHPWLLNETSVLVGQSGMGKSTLINALLPDAAVATREISTALDTGKHTTTYARLFRLDARSAVIDCPGLQEFGLSHLAPEQIASAFVEFRPYLGRCRFRDCHHAAEPDCAIKQAVAVGDIHPRRLEHFHQLIRESARGSH